MRALALLLLVSGCIEQAAEPPKPEGCTEFDHVTERDGKPWKCRMVWCEQLTHALGSFEEHYTGGAAALWCEEMKP